jgi:hypothetical protein
VLNRDEVPVGEPLAWPIVDENGTLLVASGTTLPSEACRDFLFAHFDPCRDTAEGADESSRPDVASGVERRSDADQINRIPVTGWRRGVALC